MSECDCVAADAFVRANRDAVRGCRATELLLPPLRSGSGRADQWVRRYTDGS